MKKTVIGILLLGMASAGCTGTFQLTRKVYNFHRSQADKWTDEIFFLLVSFLPVYGLATTADALIFNSIEFWTGNNPVQNVSNPGDHEKTFTQGDKTTTISYNPETDRITIATAGAGVEDSQFVLERGVSGVSAKDVSGNLLYTSALTTQGTVAVYDGDARLIKEYTPREIAKLKAAVK